jgi:hypothetical protein
MKNCWNQHNQGEWERKYGCELPYKSYFQTKIYEQERVWVTTDNENESAVEQSLHGTVTDASAEENDGTAVDGARKLNENESLPTANETSPMEVENDFTTENSTAGSEADVDKKKAV